ncbi:Polymer-forming protein [Sulfurivirga caldicuralii]|uniref:Polymer-forming protein n=1 Tax=Sulfurivirga caldicuralii TaxID=364032 RepID=A0A1N6ES75_9GAMM|nr:Polymer-forming protein [Sulfurivirga caldicuralii]
MTGLNAPLYVEGIVEGRIDSSAEVIIGPKGKVLGTLRARQVVVNGYMEGDVVCQQLDIMVSGTLQGTVVAPTFTIEQGGRFVGQSFDQGEQAQINIVQVNLEPARTEPGPALEINQDKQKDEVQ